MFREDVLFQASKYIVQDLVYLNEMRNGQLHKKKIYIWIQQDYEQTKSIIKGGCGWK